MIRQRWNCSLCGALTALPHWTDGYARCNAHAGLPSEASLLPPDPATRLPRMAAELADREDTHPARERGR